MGGWLNGWQSPRDRYGSCQGCYGSWWLVNSAPALCPAICPGLPSPEASSQLRTKTVWKVFSLSPVRSLEHLCSKQLSDRKTFVFLRNVKEGSWFLKFMNCVEWNVPSLSTGKKQRGCVFMTSKLWVISGGRNLVKPIIWHDTDLFPFHSK